MTGAPQILSSSQNPLLKDVRRAAHRGTLTEQGYLVAEGAHLLNEALHSNCQIGALIVSAELERDWPAGIPLYSLPPALFRELATTDSPQGIITLVRPRKFEAESAFSPHQVALLLDGIQDPGNAGAIVRAAEAFGGSGVVFLKSTVSPYNPKCVRASAGSLFRLPFLIHPDPDSVRDVIAARGYKLYAAVPDTGQTISQVNWSQPSAVVIGSEGRGVSDLWSAGAQPIRIPTVGVNSLNAAVAAAVILYEARRLK